MFEVECPSCKASYQVDERRVPPSGLKMRCPKCGTSFPVTLGEGAAAKEPVLGAALGLGVTRKSGQLPAVGAAPSPLSEPAAPPRPAPPRPSPLKQTMMGVAPAAQLTPPLRPEIGLELEKWDESELPAPVTPFDSLEMDLPSTQGAPRNRESFPSFSEVDLPSPSLPRAQLGEIDLPGMELEPTGGEASEGWDAELPGLPVAPDLPSPIAPRVASRAASPSFAEEFELPVVGAELPELPDLSSDLPDLSPELPDVSPGLPDLDTGLPDLDAGLPLVGGHLPVPAGSLPDLAASLPSAAGSLPELGASGGRAQDLLPEALGADDFDSEPDLGVPPVPRFGSNPPPARAGSIHSRASDPALFGQVDLEGAGDDDEFDAFPTESGSVAGASGSHEVRAGYGEVALDGGSEALALGEEVEHAPRPSAGVAALSAPVELPRGPQRSVRPSSPHRVPKRTKFIVAGVLVAAVLGGALAAVPDVGPYGAYFFWDLARESANRESLERDVRAAQQRLAADTVLELEAAFREVNRGVSDAPRFKSRAAYLSYLGLLRQIRYGEDSNIVAQAKVLLDGLKEADAAEVEHLELARLASLVVQSQSAEVVNRGSSLVTRGADHAALVGEAALRQRSLEIAAGAFEQVLRVSDSARGHFGLARVHWLAQKPEEARAEVDKTLALHESHTGALLLRAELGLTDRAQDESLVQTLSRLASPEAQASSGERVRAFTLLGELHLSRSRIKQAEAAYSEALKLEAGNSRAQRGLADTLFEAGRYSEALARYEAAAKADPESLEAELGIVQSKLRLESLDDASRILERLREKHPDSTAVAYWFGRAKEAIGQREEAQKAYEKAIELNQERAELVLAHIALTRLLGQAGALAEADRVISQAEKRFPNNPEVYKALGELASSRGSFEDAIRHYDKALELDPKNIGIHFTRGVALRQARRFDEAAAEFDEVERGEKDFPGLALERGNLFEASGRTEEALHAYESALAQAPEDLDLKLRVGCGKAAAGQHKDAITLLLAVLEERPNSAEVNFCHGLALLKEGRSLQDARRFLERAVGLDATRASYHLYVGWAALELHDYALAGRSLDRALELDRTLADAYWQRGVLRVRQGAVKDAEIDLRRALQLNPSRYEAHAALAESYLQTGKEQVALVEWKAALASGYGEPFWYYRYGKLLLDNRQPLEAKPELERSIELGSKLETPPPWLWEAHRNLALALGRTKEAIPHWEIYIEKTEKNSPYVREALRELKAILP